MPDIEEPLYSDIPPVSKEPTPEYIAWKAEILSQEAKDAEYERHIRTIEVELGPILWRYVPVPDDEGKTIFRACELRDQIRERKEFNIVTDKHTEVIYLYTEKTGVYHKDGEQYLRFIIDRVLGKEVTTHRINETIELLKIRTYATIQQSQKITVSNGLLDIQTGLLEPFTPYEFNTAKLHVEYKADAKCPKWLTFIDQICPQDKALLQEWSGYLLIKGYPYHSIMWFIGPKGRNGKGTWARTMQAILGEENYSAVQLSDLDGKHRFAVFNLHDSLLNVCSEPRADRKLTIELLQALCGEDAIDAERKGVQEPFKMVNPAKMTIMGNKFPNIDNPTDAWWERLKLIKFPFRFVGETQIPNIEKTWLEDQEERGGILNWMIEGALRLIKNKGQFTQTKTQQETIIQFKRASDTVSAFIMECVNLDIKAITPQSEPYPAYKEYCEAIGTQAKSANALNEKLDELTGVKLTSAYLGVGKEKKKTKVWKGFTLKPIPEMSEDDKVEDDEEDTANSTVQTTLGAENGTSRTTGTTFGTSLEFLPLVNPEDNKNISNIDKKLVPAVPEVLNGETPQLIIKPDETGLKHLEVNPTFKAPEVQTSNDKILYYQQVNPYVESHKCDNCGGLLATFKNPLNEEQAKQKSVKAIYSCTDCFNTAKANAETAGVKFVALPMDDPEREDF